MSEPPSAKTPGNKVSGQFDRPSSESSPSSFDQLVLQPIGFIKNRMRSKFDAPHQPDPNDKDDAFIELLPRHEFDKALSDLSGFSHIWIIWWFHRNKSWKPKGLPPRGGSTKRGVFATRSPHRPNPIGITAVQLHEIQGLTLRIGSSDLVDGTPILDIKPYLPAVDSFPDASIGWLKEVEDFYALPPQYEVTLSELAAEQLTWLRSHSILFFERAESLLRRDPSENRTRRIKRHKDSLFRMGCAEWRIFFSLEGSVVTIQFFRPGYPIERLQAPGEIPNRETQLAFLKEWPEGPMPTFRGHP